MQPLAKVVLARRFDQFYIEGKAVYPAREPPD